MRMAISESVRKLTIDCKRGNRLLVYHLPSRVCMLSRDIFGYVQITHMRPHNTTERICFPVATADLGVYAKMGAGLVAAGVSGGAVWPSMQTAVGDSKHSSVQISFLIPMSSLHAFCMGELWLIELPFYPLDAVRPCDVVPPKHVISRTLLVV